MRRFSKAISQSQSDFEKAGKERPDKCLILDYKALESSLTQKKERP
jgi:hypothetical protein